MKKIDFNQQRLKYGTLSFVTIALFIIAIVLLNVVVRTIEDRMPSKIDLTEAQVFEISDQSVEFLKTLDKDVKITVFMDERTLNDMGTEGKSIVEVINKYKQYSDHITVEYASVETNPEIFTQYNEIYNGNLEDYVAVVVCGNKIKPLSQSELIEYTMNQSSGTLDTANTTEQAVTSAIMNVIDENTMKITVLKAQSYVYIPALTEMLQANGYEVEEIDATLGEIPEDTTMIIVNTPVSDLSSITTERIEKSLYNDGKYGKNMLYLGSYKQSEMPNINSLLSSYGLTVGTGRVLDLDAANLYSVGNEYAIATTETNPKYAGYLQNNSLTILMPTPNPINVLWEVKDTRETAVLLKTANTAAVIPADADTSTLTVDQLDQSSQVIMAVGMKYDSLNAANRVGSSVLVLTSPGMVDEMFMTESSLNNANYILSAINTVNGKEQSISVTPKSLKGTMLEASDAQVNFLSVIAMIIIPLAIAVTGVVIYIRRRHK